MSRPIDEKIVKMTLDNKDFQARAAETTSIFGKLKNTFDKVKDVAMFGKSKKSLDDLNESAKRTTLQKLVDGVEKVTSKFSALGIIGATILSNLTNRAVNAGVNMVKALTVKPMTDGLGEYELKMQSVQTIMSNTQGKSNLQDVNKVLNELNLYADQTIYNFAEMTRNIGTFTAAGVSLEDSASAIKGISNLAAASGSNSQQASTAMYQLSQAMASGTVKLQDWNSVVNAGMGGKLFQKALVDQGIKMKKNIKHTDNFRDSLQRGWLTAEVLTATLNDFAVNKSMLEAATKVRTFTQLVDTAGEALGSGWAETWEILIGDFNEAGDMWTKLSELIGGIIDGAADARNAIAGDFINFGGKQLIIEALSNIFKSMVDIIKQVGKAFGEIFPPLTGATLVRLVRGFKEFTEKLKASDETLSKFKDIFKAFFAVLDLGWIIIKAVAQAFLGLIPSNLGSSFLDIVSSVARMITEFVQGIKYSQKFQDGLKSFTGMARNIGEVLGKVVSGIVSLFKGVSGGLSKLYEFIKPIISYIVEHVSAFVKSFTTEDIVSAGFIGGLIVAFKKFSAVSDKFSGFFDNILDAITNAKDGFGIFDKLSDSLEALTGAVKAKTLLAIALAVGTLAVSLKLVSTIKSEDMSKSLIAVGLSLAALVKALKSLDTAGLGLKNAAAAAIVLPALAGAVLALSVALKLLSTIDTKDMIKSIGALVAIMVVLVSAIKSLSKVDGKMATGAASMIALSAAVVILATGVKMLAKLSVKEIIKGVGAIGILLVELGIFMKIADGTKIGMGTALGVVAISAAILVMVQGIKQIATIPVNDLVKGLGVIGIILLEIAIFAKLASGTQVASAGVGMLLIAGAINALVPPIRNLGSMDLVTLAKGLGTMAISLGIVVLAMKAATGGLGGAAAITVMAVAINLLVVPLKVLGNMSVEQIASALIVLAGAFTIIGIATKFIGIQGSLVLLAFAAAVAAVGLAALAVGIGLTAFGAALSSLAVLTKVAIDNIMRALGSILEGLIKLVPQIAQLGINLILGLCDVLAAGTPKLLTTAWGIIVALLTGMRDNLPKVIMLGAEILIALMNGLADQIDPLVVSGINLMLTFIESMATAIYDNSGRLVDAVLMVVAAITKVIVEALIAIVKVVFDWIPGVSKAADAMGAEAEKALDKAFDGKGVGDKKGKEFADGIGKNKNKASTAANSIASAAKTSAGAVKLNETGSAAGLQYTNNFLSNKGKSQTAGTTVANAAKAGAKGVSLKYEGITAGTQYQQGVQDQKGKAQTSGKNVAEGAKAGAKGVELKTTGAKSGTDFVAGVSTKTGAAKTSGKKIADSGKAGAQGVDFKGAGANAGEGFASGISSKSTRVSSAAKSLAGLARGALEGILKIFSPSRVMVEDGGHFGEGFAIGVDNKGRRVVKASESLALGAVRAVRGYAKMFSEEMTDNMNLAPVITPVMDLSNLDKVEMPNKVDISGITSRNRQNGNNLQSGQNAPQVVNEYNLHLTANGELPKPVIERMADTFQTAIKNAEDRRRMSRGENVAY